MSLYKQRMCGGLISKPATLVNVFTTTKNLQKTEGQFPLYV